MLDLLAAEAESADETDEAIRRYEQAIAEEPYDEVRYRRLASLLASQGRIGSARAVIGRARRALAELDLDLTFDPDAMLATAPTGSPARS